MVIDSHAHVMLPTAVQLQMMEKAGVDRTILFSTVPHVERAADFSLQAIGTEMAVLNQLLQGRMAQQARLERMRGTIAELQQAIAAAPEKFYGFAPVPLGLTADEAAHWIEQYVVESHLQGIGEFTPGSVEQMAQLEPILCAAAEYNRLPVWVHTFHPVTASGLTVLMKLCRIYRQVPVIFGHLGGVNWMEVIAFAKGQPNVYLDLSAMYTPLAARAALAEVPERSLFSSDAPFGEPLLLRQMLELVSPSTQITKLVLGENIANLLEL